MFKWMRVLEVMFNFVNHKESYLRNSGYLKACKEKRPENLKGNPLPWMNYAVLDFFEERLNKDLSLFEYGSGFSTLYFSERLKDVTSIEYDESWFEKIGGELNDNNNVSVKYYSLDNGYAKAINDQGADKKYDLVLVDGRKRVECVRNSLVHLKDSGVLLLDDSDRDKYQEAFQICKQQGFRHITFKGLKPTGFREYATTIFYRSDNCLGI